jgi:uncharacterized RDD family membrane protein YckC
MEAVNPTSTSPDLLGDLDEIITLNYASRGQRFANYLIDIIVSSVFSLLTAVGLAVLVDSSGGDADALFDGLQGYAFGYVIVTIYFTLFEGLNKGRTLGKLITGTYAVGMDAKPLTMKQAFYRSLCRIVPLEPFSGFGTPWHDKWTETTVVKGKP